MTESISGDGEQVLPYVLSLAGILASLFLTCFGYWDNAWIVVKRDGQQDEFQRGIRGHDCYKNNSDGEHIGCIPWEDSAKSAKFPFPFTTVLDPSRFTTVSYYFASTIIILQILWLIYTIGHCCSEKIAVLAKGKRIKNASFLLCLFTAFLWVILFLVVFLQSRISDILPEDIFKEGYYLEIGKGCKLFFFGGLPPFILALCFLYGEQIRKVYQRILQWRTNHGELVPTEMTENPAHQEPRELVY